MEVYGWDAILHSAYKCEENRFHQTFFFLVCFFLLLLFGLVLSFYVVYWEGIGKSLWHALEAVHAKK